MELINRTIGKITLMINVDRESTYYINKSNDIKTIDENFVLHEISMLKDAKKTGVFKIELTAISNSQRNNIINQMNNYVNKNAKNIKSGGVITMLKNKGY